MESDVDEYVYSSEGESYFWYNESGENETNGTVVLHASPGYSTLHIIISSIFLTFMMIVVVIGNMLVIIAIATEKTLKNIQNWFIASLAVADFFVGLLIMPFSLANELMGYWIFGTLWCSIHSALDVCLCTSSIMNICLISLDRYWSITQAVDYLKKRTPGRAAVMIGMVWALSGLISIPPLLGWRDLEDNSNNPLPKCELSRDIGYVLYSALGSFYIPSCIMVFVYIQIFFAARKRARRGVRKAVPRPKPKPVPTPPKKKRVKKSPIPPFILTSPVLEPEPPSPSSPSVKAVTFQEPIREEVGPEITVESPEESSSGERESMRLEECSVELTASSSSSRNRAHEEELENKITEIASNGASDSKGTKGGPSREVVRGKRSKLNFLRVEKGGIWRTSSSLSINNGDVHILGTLSKSTSGLQLETDPVSDVEPSSSDSGAMSRCAVVKPLKFRLCHPFFAKKGGGKETAKARRDVLDVGKLPSPKAEVRDPEREKRRIARKKEKRATLILGLIMGSFILCWLPFFFLYIFDPLFPNVVQPWGFAIAFWLGYMNSALNPVIYTIFNKDFRRAFRRILFK